MSRVATKWGRRGAVFQANGSGGSIFDQNRDDSVISKPLISIARRIYAAWGRRHRLDDLGRATEARETAGLGKHTRAHVGWCFSSFLSGQTRATRAAYSST
jgi:hypothetical protein